MPIKTVFHYNFKVYLLFKYFKVEIYATEESLKIDRPFMQIWIDYRDDYALKFYCGI